MAFKIASAYVAVTPEDDGFELGLRRIVEDAAAKVEAKVGLGLRDDAPGSLREDVDVAVELVTEHLTADVGLGLRNDAVEELDADVKAGVQLVEDNNKVKVKVDPKAAQDAGQQGGSLIMAAITAGAIFGPAAILTGFSTALAAVAVLVAKSNADVQAEYKTLATDVGSTLTDAVQPIVPTIQAAMVQADNSIESLGPTLKKTFTDVAPDITTAESGIVGMATKALPGLDTAVNQSRGIVSGFFGELPQLGSGAGQFFTGLTTNAQSTERGIVDFVDVTSHALGTLGQVGGSAGAALSTAFDAVTPALNGTLDVIDKISNPATVGALIGVFGAMKLDPAISSGLQSVSNGLVSVAAKADGAGGLIGKAGTAAEKAAGGLGTMADVMGGPWGIAIGAGVGLLAGWVSNMNQSIATVSDFTAAVAQDNGVVGANTAAIIQQKLAKVDLSAVQKDLGVSQATLIEYASGEKAAQAQVTAAYNAKIDALNKTAGVTYEYGKGVGVMNNASQQEINTLARAKSQVDQVTSAVAQAIRQQNEQSRAYLAATQSADIFTGMVETATTALATQAQQQGINTAAELSFIGVQQNLDQSLSDVVGKYDLASSAANAFKLTQDALYLKYADYSQAQATFTEQLANANSQLTKGKNAIDLHTEAGAKNFSVLNQLAQSNELVAESLIKQGGSAADATASLQKGAQAIDDLAKKSGFTDKQIEQLNIDLYGVPKVKDITFNANTSPAVQALNGLLQRIDSSSGTVQIYATSHNPSGGKALGANADGGPVQAGDYSLVGERGPEIVQFGRSGVVIPNEAIRKVSGDAALAKGSALGGVTIQNLTIPITGIVDLTDPNSMSIAARRMVVNLQNALNQVQRSTTGARYR